MSSAEWHTRAVAIEDRVDDPPPSRIEGTAEWMAPGAVAMRAVATGKRVLRAARQEFDIPVRSTFARVVSHALPQFAFNRARTAILRAAGLRIGSSMVMGAFDVTGPGGLAMITVGDDTFITGPLHIDVGAPVRIGDRVHIGHHVLFLTLNHEIGPPEERCGPLKAAPVTVGNGVWIGSRVTLLPGVSVGDGAIVAAGSVVTRDVARNTLVAGVPAVLVRNLSDSGAGPQSAR